MSAAHQSNSETADKRSAVRLWLRLLGCTRLIEKRLRRRLAALDSTLPRFDVLAALHREPAGLTLSALSQTLLVSNGNVTGIVQLLAREGSIDSRASAFDRRVQIVSLTLEGRRRFEQMREAHHDVLEDMLQGLARTDRHHLFVLLGELKTSISGHPPGSAG